MPFLLDVQADLLDRLATRVEVPLALASEMHPDQHPNPAFDVDGKAVVTADVTGVPMSAIGAPVADLGAKRAAILSALDVLFAGV
ncbi:MAG: plasmid maintenance protein CcdB [Proteobacteria bacterium]|nr:MAG: plasmid maintenance protein CcdB [Pseudomonadota bacterium]PIE17923.1 MAG: plasmid maintenance protein CcdB [Pseudomonadota bacterium]